MDTTTIFWDGASYWAGIEDSSSVADTCDYDTTYDIPLVSTCTLWDVVTMDITNPAIDDAGLLLLKKTATKVPHFSEAQEIMSDGNGDLICLSDKFFWHISKTDGTVNYYKFLYPNLQTIKCARYYDEHIYVLQYWTEPTDIYQVFSDTLMITDAGYAQGNEYTATYLSAFYYPPDEPYKARVFTERKVLKFSKYDLNGYEVSSFYYELGNPFLNSPVSFDILDDNFYIADQGTSSVKVLTMDGIFVKEIKSRYFNIVSQLNVVDSQFLWVIDTTVAPTFGYRHRIKKIDYTIDMLMEEHPYTYRPFMWLTRSESGYNTYVLERVTTLSYRYYKDFILDTQVTTALGSHSVDVIHATSKGYLYVLNHYPVEIEIVNLKTRNVKWLRECVEPINITGLAVDGDEVVLSDIAFHEVGRYYLYGRKDNVLFDNVLPKGIVKLGGDYYVTDIQFGAVFKIVENESVRKIYTNIARPTDIATDGTYLYVVDNGGNKIIKIDTDGNEILRFGKYGKYESQFDYPLSLTINDDVLYVLDYGNFRVQLFELDGTYIKEFVLSPPIEYEYKPGNVTLTSFMQAVEGSTDYNVDGFSPNQYSQGKPYFYWGSAGLIGGQATIYPLYGMQFQFNKTKYIPVNATIDNARLTIPIVYFYTPLSTTRVLSYSFQIENSVTPLPYKDPINTLGSRYTFEDVLVLPIAPTYTGIFSPTTSANLIFPDISSLISLVHANTFWGKTSTISILGTIQTTGMNGTPYVEIIKNTPTLSIDYTEIIYKRRKGFYYYMTVDNTNLYVSDIAANKINVYDKTTGSLIEQYDFEGTIFKDLTNDIFITDKNCAISYINKFEWQREHLYTIEMMDMESESYIYNFVVEWHSDFTEGFEKAYSLDVNETFEWFGNIDFILSILDESDLSIPEIEWVI